MKISLIFSLVFAEHLSSSNSHNFLYYDLNRDLALTNASSSSSVQISDLLQAIMLTWLLELEDSNRLTQSIRPIYELISRIVKMILLQSYT